MDRALAEAHRRRAEVCEAIRTGDPEIYVPIGNLGDQPARDINSFATNNGIDACVL